MKAFLPAIAAVLWLGTLPGFAAKPGSTPKPTRSHAAAKADTKPKPAPPKPDHAVAVHPPAPEPGPDVEIPWFPPTPTLGPEGVPIAPFPAWADADELAVQSGDLVPGAFLLTDAMPPEEPPTPQPVPFKVAGPTPEELAGDPNATNTIPDKLLATYFGEHPKSFLIDPQKLLTPSQYRNDLAFLESHATESYIDLYVYVFGGTQEIPGEVRAEELAERQFSSGRPSAFVYYYLGAPQRSVFYLSPSLTDIVSTPEQRRALLSSVDKALEKSDAGEQLEAFNVQMSIRLYWMEHMLKGTAVAGGMVASSGIDAKPPDPPGRLALLLRKLPDRWWVPAGVLLGSVLAGFAVRLWLQFRMRYRFPSFEVEPRLGGSHAAGVGAVISFASSSLPPAVQREQVPDYLRRA